MDFTLRKSLDNRHWRKKGKRYQSGTTPNVPGMCPPPTQSGLWPRVHRSTGSGTYPDPWIIWAISHELLPTKPELLPAMVDAIDRICKLEAIEQGFKCVVVRSGVHGTYTVRDTATGRITGHLPVDQKVTVYMGQSWAACQIQGHIYVDLDQQRLPVSRVREPEARKLIAPGCKAAGTDFWLLEGRCLRPSWGLDACPIKAGEGGNGMLLEGN